MRIARNIRLFLRGRAARGDSGVTIVELATTLLILGISFGITCGLLIGLQTQDVNVGATVKASESSEFASSQLVQFLRAGETVSAASKDGMSVYSIVGFDASGEETALVNVAFTPASGRLGVGKLTMSMSQWESGPSGGGSTTTTLIPVNNANAYDVLAPPTVGGTPGQLFTYLRYSTDGSGTLVPIAFDASGDVPGSCLSYIAAIKLNITFYAPGVTLARGYADDNATTMSNEVFLRNSSAFQTTPTATTTSGALPCT
ncbi:MAG TPA: hypothetical protein VGS21_12135 [Acidimicrobiales bacterium]|nr:hypothetical protein [Acidimicrobiales bacterium]